MRFRAVLFSCILIAACRQARQETGAPLAKSVEAAVGVEDIKAVNRPVYPYSIIEGGAHTPEELKRAVEKDPVVARHYAHINPEALRPLKLTNDTSGYVSYRVGEQVYWTSKKVNLRKGELVLSDGEHWVRGRCGNQISETPQFPVMVPVHLEPTTAALETAVKPEELTGSGEESRQNAESVPAQAGSAPGIGPQSLTPNAPAAQIPSGNYDRGGPVVMTPGATGPVASGIGGGGGGASGGGTGAGAVFGTGGGYPPSPFLTPIRVVEILPPLPPFQVGLLPTPTPPGLLPPWEGLPTPTTTSFIPTLLPPTFQLPVPTGVPYYPPTVTIPAQPPWFPLPPPVYLPPPPDTPESPPPQGVTPPVRPPELPRPTPRFPPPIDITSPPELPEVSTPEPSTLTVTGISLLILAGCYMLAKLRPG
jgi:hypothetical protein